MSGREVPTKASHNSVGRGGGYLPTSGGTSKWKFSRKYIPKAITQWHRKGGWIFRAGRGKIGAGGVRSKGGHVTILFGRHKHVITRMNFYCQRPDRIGHYVLIIPLIQYRRRTHVLLLLLWSYLFTGQFSRARCTSRGCMLLSPRSALLPHRCPASLEWLLIYRSGPATPRRPPWAWFSQRPVALHVCHTSSVRCVTYLSRFNASSVRCVV